MGRVRTYDLPRLHSNFPMFGNASSVGEFPGDTAPQRL